MSNTTTLEIHPAIGIARVGSSQEFFVGPEPGLPLETNRRDGSANKLLKRQAARFRVYSCVRDAQGTLVSSEELKPAVATITWKVHLVNRKAAAPRFLTVAQQVNTNPAIRRNGATGNDTTDNSLIIDGGLKSLTGASQAPLAFAGNFKTLSVPLGDMSTDAQGRLIVAGGFGKSRSLPLTAIDNFADNDNWQDDTSDGPVEAHVHFLDGRADQDVDKPAWVICCQPDFAPAIGNMVTLYDALLDQAMTRGLITLPTFVPAYDRDIFPLLNRALGYQWVNHFNRNAHGPGSVGDFSANPGLGNPAGPAGPRNHIFGLLRNPNTPATLAANPGMPALFSDDYFTNSTLTQLLTRSQYRILAQWAAGSFTATGPAHPAQGEPDALTQTVLDACVGASFCPGIEAGRKIRSDIYSAGEIFRFDRSKLKPGGLTESMALPWQADFALCRWEAPGTPTPANRKGRGWWPAQRPDDVFLKPDDTTMARWDVGADTEAKMVDNWDRLGIVLPATDSLGNPVFVETQRVLAR